MEPDMGKKILEALTECPKGMSQKAIQSSFPNVSNFDLCTLLNTYLKQGKIQVLQKSNQLVYVSKANSGSKKIVTSDIEEKIILQAVQKAGNSGITARDLKYQCNMPQPQITKILKGFEAKKIVKSIMSVSKKKLFMLYDLEPSCDVTGGTFYSETEFEEEFVRVLGVQCYKYIVDASLAAEKLGDPVSQKRASTKSAKEICDYINGIKLSKVALAISDIEKILESLIYDGKLEKSVVVSKLSKPENLYRITKSMVVNVGVMRMPCGVCRVYEECGKGLEVSPSTCVYMKEWLSF